MTAVRKSIKFAPESEFGSGSAKKDSNDKEVWYAPPPGFFISHTANRQAESVYTTGSKKRQTTAYGLFSGSWSMSFVMDYSHLELLSLIMECDDEGTPVSGKPGYYDHVFYKDDLTRIPSFVIKECILNKIAGGSDGSDEVTTLKGCVVKSINISRTMSGSQMNVEMSGVYADQVTVLGTGVKTYFTPYDDSYGLTQYSCMFIDSIDDNGYVRDVDSHSMSIEVNSNLLYNVCTPFATSYFEGQSQFQWNAQTYSNDPTKKFKLLPNSGGFLSSDRASAGGRALAPMSKGLKPLKKAYFVTYSGSVRDDNIPDDTITNAINRSDYLIKFEYTDSTIKAMTWQKGDGSKMMDSLSSVECSNLVITVRNKNQYVWANEVISEEVPSSYTFADSAKVSVLDGNTWKDNIQVLAKSGFTVERDRKFKLTQYVTVGDNSLPIESFGWAVLDPDIPLVASGGESEIEIAINEVFKDMKSCSAPDHDSLNKGVYNVLTASSTSTTRNVACVVNDGVQTASNTRYYLVAKVETLNLNVSGDNTPTMTISDLAYLRVDHIKEE